MPSTKKKNRGKQPKRPPAETKAKGGVDSSNSSSRALQPTLFSISFTRDQFLRYVNTLRSIPPREAVESISRGEDLPSHAVAYLDNDDQEGDVNYRQRLVDAGLFP